MYTLESGPEAFGGATTLLLLVLKATLLIAVGAVFTTLQRRAPASVRAATWAAAVGALAMLPLLTALVPGWGLPWLPAGESAAAAQHPGPQPPTPKPNPFETSRRVTSAFGSQAQVSVDGALPMPARGEAALTPLAAAAARPLRFSAGNAALALWLAGSATALFLLLRSLVRAHGLVHRSRPVFEPLWSSVVAQADAPARLLQRVSLRESEDCPTPVTFGWRRPVVLVPRGFAGWSQGCRRNALVHEFAHVARRDWPLLVLARVACALFWFHPGAWWAARRLAHECEKASDDRVLLHGSRATDYADHLLELAMHIQTNHSIHAAVAMSRPERLSDRIHSILDPRRKRTTMNRRDAFTLSVAMLALGVPLAASRLVPAQATPSQSLTLRPANAAQGDRAVRETAQGDAIHCPRPEDPLRERLAWAVGEVTAGRHGAAAWVAWTVLGKPGNISFSSHGDGDSERRLLSERVFGPGSGRDQWRAHLDARKQDLERNEEPQETALLLLINRDGSIAKARVATIWTPFEKEGALLWLGRAQDAESLPLVESLLGAERREEAREDLVTLIALHGDGSAVVPVLTRLLQNDSSNEVREDAAFWLSQQDRDAEVLPVLLGAIAGNAPMDLKEKAVFAISQLERSLAANALLELSGGAYVERVREQALFWLGQVDEETALLEYRRILAGEPSEDTVEKAIFGLSQLAPELGGPALRDALYTHPDSDIRKNALFWLAQCDPRAAAEEIDLLLARDGDADLCEHATFVLTQLPKETGQPVLERTARLHRSSEVRQKAVFWLGNEGGDEVLPALGEILLADTDIEVQKAVVFAFYNMETAGALERLDETARSHPDARVRENARFWMNERNGDQEK